MNANPRIWRVYSGDVSLSKLSFGASKEVNKIIPHEAFDPKTNNNDIALLKLSEPLKFTSKSSVKFTFHSLSDDVNCSSDDGNTHVYVSGTVKPVCLPNADMDISAGNQAWITGWGTLRSSGQPKCIPPRIYTMSAESPASKTVFERILLIPLQGSPAC